VQRYPKPHPLSNIPLYTKKPGGFETLAGIVDSWGTQHYPALSIPTAGEVSPIAAKESVKDALRAVGAGFHLILPTKIFAKDTSAFKKEFSTSNDSPAWWGTGASVTPEIKEQTYEELNNLSFPDYYQQQFQMLEKLCNATTAAERTEILQNLPADFQAAYQEGLAEKEKQKRQEPPSPWYAPADAVIAAPPTTDDANDDWSLGIDAPPIRVHTNPATVTTSAASPSARDYSESKTPQQPVASEAKQVFLKYTLPPFFPNQADRHKNKTPSEIATYIEEACKKRNIAPQKAVFVFPGRVANTSDPDAWHHSPTDGYHNKPLYALKAGANLADVANRWGERGRPSLSIPTVANGNDLDKAATPSIEDLWEAIGYGLHIIIPMRSFEHNNGIFPEAFSAANDSPAWWGGIARPPSTKFSAELTLPGYYQQELQKLERFCNATPEEREKLLAALPENFRKAYAKGLAERSAATPSNWYAPPNPTATTAVNNLDEAGLRTPLLSRHDDSDAPLIKRLSSRAKWLWAVVVGICMGGLATVALVPTDVVAVMAKSLASSALGGSGAGWLLASQIALPVLATLLAVAILAVVMRSQLRPETKRKLAIAGAILFVGAATVASLLFFGVGALQFSALQTFSFSSVTALYALPIPIASVLVVVAAIVAGQDLQKTAAERNLARGPAQAADSRRADKKYATFGAANPAALTVPNNTATPAIVTTTANPVLLPSSSLGGRAPNNDSAGSTDKILAAAIASQAATAVRARGK
jgi:hypothetical protein